MNSFSTDQPYKKWIASLALVTFDIDEGNCSLIQARKSSTSCPNYKSNPNASNN